MNDDLIEQAGEGTTVNLSLISHTNAGKTTLARTLLGRDIGEVRDAAHVTDLASGHVLVQAGEDTLMLWDTPGFGDTARLLSRLRMSGNPIGWFLNQVWDRWRERPLWSSQQAVRNAREHADVILYMVNASEDPAATSYVALEMEVLEWIGKPVVVLLNQLGPPQEDVSDEIARWRKIGSPGQVAATLPLDAFARVWVQEEALLEVVEPLLPPEKRDAMESLRRRWHELNHARFSSSMEVLADYLLMATRDREPVEDAGWQGKLTSALAGRGKGDAAASKAMKALSLRLAEATAQSTDALIELHNLSGRAARKVHDRVAQDYAHNEKITEGAAGALGGLLTGAATGLGADLMAGGLTLGGGLIVGGILGALGGTAAARGINMVRGEDGSTVRWAADFHERLTVTALLRYLAVAHYGRGRGNWDESEHPAHWQGVVEAAVAKRASTFADIRAAEREDGDRAKERMASELRETGLEVLRTLYPHSAVKAQDESGELGRAAYR